MVTPTLSFPFRAGVTRRETGDKLRKDGVGASDGQTLRGGRAPGQGDATNSRAALGKRTQRRGARQRAKGRTNQAQLRGRDADGSSEFSQRTGAFATHRDQLRRETRRLRLEDAALRDIALAGFELLLDRGQDILRLRTRTAEQSGTFLQRPGAVIDDRGGIQHAQHIRFLLEVGRRAQGNRVSLAQAKIGWAQRLFDLDFEGASIFRFLGRVARADLEGGV